MLKYQKQIEGIQNCPPPVCRSITIESFRFVFEDINHRNNFLPVLLINPKRQLTADPERCSGYALSFFCSIGKAKTQYLKLKKRNKNIGKSLGTHIAQGFINETDGLVSEINKNGHFDLHEFKNVDLKSKFSIVCLIEG
jgi:hypothetical protein